MMSWLFTIPLTWENWEELFLCLERGMYILYHLNFPAFIIFKSQVTFSHKLCLQIFVHVVLCEYTYYYFLTSFKNKYRLVSDFNHSFESTLQSKQISSNNYISCSGNLLHFTKKSQVCLVPSTMLSNKVWNRSICYFLL